MSDPKRTDQELRHLGQTWFSEARQKSLQDEAEIAAWKKEHRKWTGYGWSGFGDGTGGSSGGGGGDGGGD